MRAAKIIDYQYMKGLSKYTPAIKRKLIRESARFTSLCTEGCRIGNLYYQWEIDQRPPEIWHDRCPDGELRFLYIFDIKIHPLDEKPYYPLLAVMIVFVERWGQPEP